jgi:NADH-quinone oxidoreductase subunit E
LTSLPESLIAELDELCAKYPEQRAGLIPALHRCQEELGGWLSPEVLEGCAEYFGLEPVEVYGVASFYPMFHLQPVGKHVIGVCRNISCDLRGARELLERTCAATGVASPGKSSQDNRFYVETLECQGACCDAPMMVVDGAYHENLSPDDVERIVGGLS